MLFIRCTKIVGLFKKYKVSFSYFFHLSKWTWFCVRHWLDKTLKKLYRVWHPLGQTLGCVVTDMTLRGPHSAPGLRDPEAGWGWQSEDPGSGISKHGPTLLYTSVGLWLPSTPVSQWLTEDRVFFGDKSGVFVNISESVRQSLIYFCSWK